MYYNVSAVSFHDPMIDWEPPQLCTQECGSVCKQPGKLKSELKDHLAWIHNALAAPQRWKVMETHCAMGAVLLLSLLGQRTWQSSWMEERFESQFEYSSSWRKMCGRAQGDSWDFSRLESQEVERREFCNSAGFLPFPIFLVHKLWDGTTYTQGRSSLLS